VEIVPFTSQIFNNTRMLRVWLPGNYFSPRNAQRKYPFMPSMLFSPPNSFLYRVIYDRAKQEQATKVLAEATLRFYREGLNEERLKDPDLWAREFFQAWDEWVYRLAPLAKDYRWQSESEFRIVHELNVSEFPKVRFRQRKTMLSRYVVLEFPHVVKRRASLLPIAKIMIGPGNHPAFTRVSVKLLLEQMGYPDIPVEITRCSRVSRPVAYGKKTHLRFRGREVYPTEGSCRLALIVFQQAAQALPASQLFLFSTDCLSRQRE
jgi:hypothetical protein